MPDFTPNPTETPVTPNPTETPVTPNPTETIISSVESLEIKNEDETKIVLFRLEEKTIAELKKVFNIFNSFVDAEIKALCDEIKAIVSANE